MMLVLCGVGGPGVADGCCRGGGDDDDDLCETRTQSGPNTTADSATNIGVCCAGCGGSICDRYYLLAVDRRWHVACLTCCQCKVQLDSELTCFARDGHIYCKEDYYRLFSVKRCNRCHLSISPSELVMRARDHVYHLHCFTCATCNKPLTKGEYFGLKEDIIYCRIHYEMVLQYERPPNPYTAPPALKEEGENAKIIPSDSCNHEVPSSLPNFQQQQHCALQISSFHNNQMNGPSRANVTASSRSCSASTTLKTAGHKGRPRKQKNFLSSSILITSRRGSTMGLLDDSSILNNNQQHGSLQPSSNHLVGGSDSSTSSEHMSRPKRMRTSFKHHQLRAMKSYFAINHNPDAKDLKQLSQKTGLSKRVLQVWFQNARAKWRRNLLRQQSQGPEIAQDSKPLSELASQGRFCDSLRLDSSLVDVQPTAITQEEQNIQTFTNLL